MVDSLLKHAVYRQKNVLVFFVLFHSLFSDVLQEKHFLHYKFTALTKADTFPEFSAVGVAHDKRISHFSNEERDWVRDGRTVYWTNTPEKPPDSREWFIYQLKMLSDCTDSQCSELHVLQRIIGCELENLPDGSVNLTVFDEYGFDGEDFISFNPGTMKWIDKSPKAKETKVKWDSQTVRNQVLQYYLNKCVNWIPMFHETEKCSPDVHVSVSKAPDDQNNHVLSCLATGFYPRDVQMNIRLDRTKLEDQTSTGLRPNEDETFQMRISVKIDRNHKGCYDCQVTHNSLTEPVTVKWDGKCIDRKMSQWHITTGIVVIVFLFVFCWLICKMKRFNGQNNSNNESAPVQTAETKR